MSSYCSKKIQFWLVPSWKRHIVHKREELENKLNYNTWLEYLFLALVLFNSHHDVLHLFCLFFPSVHLFPFEAISWWHAVVLRGLLLPPVCVFGGRAVLCVSSASFPPIIVFNLSSRLTGRLFGAGRSFSSFQNQPVDTVNAIKLFPVQTVIRKVEL